MPFGGQLNHFRTTPDLASSNLISPSFQPCLQSNLPAVTRRPHTAHTTCQKGVHYVKNTRQRKVFGIKSFRLTTPQIILNLQYINQLTTYTIKTWCIFTLKAVFWVQINSELCESTSSRELFSHKSGYFTQSLVPYRSWSNSLWLADTS